jgi:hypothetical protein
VDTVPASHRPLAEKTLLSPATLFVFLVEVLALASFLWQKGFLELFSRADHSLVFCLASGLLTAVLVGAAALMVVSRYSSFLASRTREHRRPLAQAIVLTLTPLLFLPLIFLQRVVYLREIGPAVVLASLAGFLCLHGLFLSRIRRQFPGKIFQPQGRTGFPPRLWRDARLPYLALFLFFGFYALLAWGKVFPAQPVTGDEPHYLILAKSLLSDRDLNLSNNYQDQDYLQFYPGVLQPHTRTGKRGPQFQYSLHATGLPLLLLPFYYAGEKISSAKSPASDLEARRKIFVFLVRLPLCFLAALLGFLVFRLTRDITRSPQASWAAWLVLGLTPPLLFYAYLIYPEVPAAVILIWVFRSSVINRNFGEGRCLLAGLGTAFLPWLGIKYTVLAAGISLLVVLSLLQAEKGRGRKLLLFLAPLLVSAGLYLFYLWSLYGTFSPFSFYEGIEQRNMMFRRFFHFNPADILRSGLAYLFDQRIGILAYSPIILLFFPGIILAWRKSKRVGVSLLVVFSLYWGLCSLVYYWGGFCPPGRTLLPVLWVMAIFVAHSLATGLDSGGLPQEADGPRFQGQKRFFIYTLLALSLLVAFLSLNHPQLLYHENLSNRLDPRGSGSHLLASLSNAFVDFRGFVPALSGQKADHGEALAAWILAALLLSFLFLRKAKPKSRPPSYRQAVWPLLLVHGLSVLFIAYVFFNIRLNDPAALGPAQVRVFFQDDNHYSPEAGGFWTKGRSRARLLIQSPTKVKSISVTVSSPRGGKTFVQVARSRDIVLRDRANGLEQTSVFQRPVGFPWKGGYLYLLQVHETNGFVPFQLDRRVQDNRLLGVLVKIQVY